MAFPGTRIDALTLESAIRATVGACICPEPGIDGICTADLQAEKLWDSMGAVHSVASALVKARQNRERWLVLECSEVMG